MATGWHIKAGYSGRHKRAEVEAALDLVIAEVRNDTAALIVADARPALREYLEHYASCDDVTITRHDSDGRVEWLLMASGGDPSRLLKEQARRAFVRVVMERMHARDMDISVVVA